MACRLEGAKIALFLLFTPQCRSRVDQYIAGVYISEHFPIAHAGLGQTERLRTGRTDLSCRAEQN
jgi:hypothetical protein